MSITILVRSLCHRRHANLNEPPMNKNTGVVTASSNVNSRDYGAESCVVITKDNGHTIGHNKSSSLPRHQQVNSHFDYVTSADVARQTIMTLNGTCKSTSRLQNVEKDYWQ